MRIRGLAILLALSACVAAERSGGITGAASDDALAGPAMGEIRVRRGEAVGPWQVGRACAQGRRPPGEVVEQSPAEGAARWRIHDTAPGSTRARTHYITGFSDGCARQVTGALVVFGRPAVYEALRLSSANRASRAATDRLYEQIKSRICRVEPQSVCPSQRMDRLEARTTFVSIYPRLGSLSERLELLLDRGALLAQAQVR